MCGVRKNHIYEAALAAVEPPAAPRFVGTHSVFPAARIVVVVAVFERIAPEPLGSEYVTTVNESLPAGTAIVAVQFNALPTARTQPEVEAVKFILTGATMVLEAEPLT